MEAMGSWLMDAFAGACGIARPSPHYQAMPCTLREANDELRRMAVHPTRLERPILVVGAYHAWAPVQWTLARKLCRATGAAEQEIVPVSFLFETSLHAAAVKAVRRAIEAWGLAPGGATMPVDVVGISMGGLVSRMAAAGDNAALGLPLELPRLDARRIFTFASPLRGARMALRARPDRAARDMRPGSALLHRLGSCNATGPELVCYAQLRDNMVGATRTAPEGMEPIWSSGTPVFSHFTTPHNPWFLVDMARRLRGEEPLLQAVEPPPHD